jgi:Ankyrin repeats (many copies)
LQATLNAIQRGELPVNSVRPLDGMMVIHAVAAYGSLSGVKFLVGKGSAIHHPDARGWHPIDYARNAGHVDVANYLQEQLLKRVLASMPSIHLQDTALALLRGSEVATGDLALLFAYFGWNLSPSGKRAIDPSGSEIVFALTGDAVRFARQLVETRVGRW